MFYEKLERPHVFAYRGHVRGRPAVDSPGIDICARVEKQFNEFISLWFFSVQRRVKHCVPLVITETKLDISRQHPLHRSN